MNEKALSLGLSSTHFVTPHGLDDDEHYTTAYELALITDSALNNETLKKIVGTHNYTVTISGRPKTISNTNELLGVLEGVYGVKTGFTGQAGRCLVSSTKRNDLDIITVVLGSDTKKIRTQDSAKLINYSFNNFTLIDLESKIKEKYNYFKKYIEPNIEIYKAKPEIKFDTYLSNITYKKYPMKKNSIYNINITLDSTDYLEAPIPKNYSIGKISIFIGNDYLFDCKILVKSDIDRKDFFYYFRSFITEYKLFF